LIIEALSRQLLAISQIVVRYRCAPNAFQSAFRTRQFVMEAPPENLGPLAKVWPLGKKLDVLEYPVWPLREKPEDLQQNLGKNI
jgi:hypothetical protein